MNKQDDLPKEWYMWCNYFKSRRYDLERLEAELKQVVIDYKKWPPPSTKTNVRHQGDMLLLIGALTHLIREARNGQLI